MRCSGPITAATRQTGNGGGPAPRIKTDIDIRTRARAEFEHELNSNVCGTARPTQASKIARAHEPCSKVIQQTELMAGLGDTHAIKPRRKESLAMSMVDWLTKVLFRLRWCDLAFQDADGGMCILDSCEWKGGIRSEGPGAR